MKIGIITFHDVDNYGAAWQCFGLGDVLKRLGHEPFVINYIPTDGYPVYRMPIGRFGLTPRMVAYFKRRLSFKNFRRRYVPQYLGKYNDIGQLEADPPRVDLLIAGSDQIWNRAIFEGSIDPAYFLDFANGVPKISYAASFGEHVSIELTDELGKFLEKFDSISVREKAVAEQLMERFGLKVWTTCDPVMLVEDFQRFLGKMDVEGKYVFCYNLYNQPFTDRVSILAGKILDSSVRRINDDWKIWKYTTGREYGVGPIRWLNLIAGSQGVVTDSFHATLFSLLFQKRFVVVLANIQTGGENRIVNLLKEVGLEDRIASGEDLECDIDRRLVAPVDWKLVKTRIRRMSKASLEFLTDAIDSATQGCG